MVDVMSFVAGINNLYRMPGFLIVICVCVISVC